MTDSLLELQVDAKAFGKTPILEDIQFHLSASEIVGLVGPSGCGKSTLLRIVAGLERQYHGSARVLGEPVQVHSRHVGFIFQEPRLLPWLTVAQNVGFELGKAGARHPQVAALLAEVGLSDYANAYPKQLSGGMAQRASIARGLFTQPELLLLDEPFSAVDAFTRMRLQDLLLEVARRHGTTLLLVTHDIDEALYLSDRVLIMSTQPGRITGEVCVPLPRARDRRDPELARLKARVLTLLDGGLPAPLDVAEEAAEVRRQLLRINPETFAFAI